jgi:hypothetical protein
VWLRKIYKCPWIAIGYDSRTVKIGIMETRLKKKIQERIVFDSGLQNKIIVYISCLVMVDKTK